MGQWGRDFQQVEEDIRDFEDFLLDKKEVQRGLINLEEVWAHDTLGRREVLNKGVLKGFRAEGEVAPDLADKSVWVVFHLRL